LSRKAGKLDEARAHYQQALAGSPNATWILHELADICRHLGRLEEAYAHLEHAKSMDPYNATTYGYFADLLRHEGKVAEAQANLEKAVEIDGEYTWAWRELAELRALSGKHAEAEECYRKACQLETDEPINDGLKAFLLRCQNRRDAAIPYLERAVERQPDYLWAWREQIEFHLIANHPDEAEAVATRAIAALPHSAPIYGMLAEAQRRMGKRALARASVAKALEIADDVPQLWAIRAELSAEDDDYAGARRSAERAVELDSGVEYKALLAQVLIASAAEAPVGSSAQALEDAGRIVAGLLKLDRPIQPAFELAASLAERRGDLLEAKAICDRALAGTYQGDSRLLLRRARLAVLSAEKDPTSRLEPLFTQQGTGKAPAPWREIAHVFAQAHQPILARRAVYLHLSSAAPSAEEQAKAWLAIAETELGLGNLDEAGQALERALERDPDCVSGRILGAVLADQRDDLPAAIAHLVHLDQRLQERVRAGSSAQGTDPGLLRQLALLYERARQPDSAAATWERLRKDPRRTPQLYADYACYLVRRGDQAQAEAVIAEVLAACPTTAPELQRLLREIGLSAANRAGAPAGAKELLKHEAILATSNRIVLAELAIAGADFALARRQLERARAEEPDNRAVRLLHVRALIGAHELREAEALARALWEESRGDEAAAVLVAECLSLRERFAEAQAVLTDPALPARPGADRGLLAAIIAFEVDGVHHGLAKLGRAPLPKHPTPLVRLFAAAYPGVWATPVGDDPIRPEDLFHLPPFPHLASHLAEALSAQGRHDLAATLLVAVARVIDGRGDATHARA
ncbi:MAG: tetratricopeptide repeat protein, partial [Planctomycetes bacterium]|nr:tetratricopeptide repeat protein [Planctomycetota bacterium]